MADEVEVGKAILIDLFEIHCPCGEIILSSQQWNVCFECHQAIIGFDKELKPVAIKSKIK